MFTSISGDLLKLPIRKCNIPFNSLIKWLSKMQNFFLEIPTFVLFLGPFWENLMFLKNRHGRHEKDGMPTHYVFIFHEFQ